MLRSSLTDFLINREKWANRRFRFFAFLKRHRRVVLLAVVALFLVSAPIPFLNAAHAQSTGVQECSFPNVSVIGCMGSLLSWIVKMIGTLLLFLIDIFMGFVAYNDFANATPVAIGWTIVRDVVNMFFIVVLLVSAFATIIGYDSHNFSYDRVLPKLLLMAILINFSRTLIQLLVDFSQVIMLTFVNAFKDAAAGNFVTAFGLQNLMRVSQATPGPNAPEVTLPTLVTTYLLAIGVLIIMVMVMVAMIAFIIVRVVGIWMLLIFSPIALFATALPERLKKGFGIFTNDYWSQLSGFLMGGPVMAFFLYLTLATVQQATQAQKTVAASTNLFAVSNTTGVGAFLSAWGTSDQIATFIVALAMMLMGLKAGTQIAGAVPGFTAINNLIRSLPRRAAGIGLAAGSLGAQGVAWTGRETGRYAGMLAKPITRAAAGAALAIPGVRSAFRAPLARAAAAKGLEQQAEKKRLLEPTKGMRDNPALLARYRESLSASGAGGLARAEIDKMLGKTETGRTLLARSNEAERNSLKNKLKAGAVAGFGAVAAKAKEKAASLASAASGLNLKGRLMEAIKPSDALDASAIAQYRAANLKRNEAKQLAGKEYLDKAKSIMSDATLTNPDKELRLAEVKAEKEKKILDANNQFDADKKGIKERTLGGAKKFVTDPLTDTGAKLRSGYANLQSGRDHSARVGNAAQQLNAALKGIDMSEKAELDHQRETVVNPERERINDLYKRKIIDKGARDVALADLESRVIGKAKEPFDNDRKSARVAYDNAVKESASELESAKAMNIAASRGGAVANAIEGRTKAEVDMQAEIQIIDQGIEQRSSALDAAMSAFKSTGDTDGIAEIRRQYLVDPHLSTGQEFDDAMTEITLDKKLQSALSDEALTQGPVLAKLAGDAIRIEASGDVHVDPAEMKRVVKSLDKRAAKAVGAMLKKIQTGEISNAYESAGTKTIV